MSKVMERMAARRGKELLMADLGKKIRACVLSDFVGVSTRIRRVEQLKTIMELPVKGGYHEGRTTRHSQVAAR